jgi:hypothetical protein
VTGNFSRSMHTDTRPTPYTLNPNCDLNPKPRTLICDRQLLPQRMLPKFAEGGRAQDDRTFHVVGDLDDEDVDALDALDALDAQTRIQSKP